MSLFDTTNASTTGVEDGDHLGTIVGCEVKQSRTGECHYLNVRWKLESGASVFKMYVFKHDSSPMAENIGRGTIRKLQEFNGVEPGPVNSTEELLGFRALLSIKNKTDDYGEKADVVNHKKAQDAGDGMGL